MLMEFPTLQPVSNIQNKNRYGKYMNRGQGIVGIRIADLTHRN